MVDPQQDEVSGGLPDDMDIVAIGGDRSVADQPSVFAMASGWLKPLRWVRP